MHIVSFIYIDNTAIAIIVAMLMPTLVKAQPSLMFLTKSDLCFTYHNVYIINKATVSTDVDNPAITDFANTKNKNTNKAFEKLDTTQLLKRLYHFDFIKRFDFLLFSSIKYPGVHNIKNAKGIDKIAFHGLTPIVVTRLYFA